MLQRPPLNFEGYVRMHFHSRKRAILTVCNEYVNGRVRVGWYGVSDDVGDRSSPSRVKVSREFKASMQKLYPRMVVAFQHSGASLIREMFGTVGVGK